MPDLIAVSALAVQFVIAVLLFFATWHLKLMNDTNAMTRRAELMLIRDAVSQPGEQAGKATTMPSRPVAGPEGKQGEQQ